PRCRTWCARCSGCRSGCETRGFQQQRFAPGGAGHGELAGMTPRGWGDDVAPIETGFESGTRAGRVSALLLRPPDAWLLYVLAHGAGAGMRHAFMEDVARRLAARGVATFRYQFPYMEAGGKRPDPPWILQ